MNSFPHTVYAVLTSPELCLLPNSYYSVAPITVLVSLRIGGSRSFLPRGRCGGLCAGLWSSSWSFSGSRPSRVPVSPAEKAEAPLAGLHCLPVLTAAHPLLLQLEPLICCTLALPFPLCQGSALSIKGQSRIALPFASIWLLLQLFNAAIGDMAIVYIYAM